MGKSGKERIIDLNSNGSDHLYSKNSNKKESGNKILQVEAFEQLDKIVRAQIKGLDTYKDECASENGSALTYPRLHNAILIEGGRGSGKTTFLLNALDELRQPSPSYDWFEGLSDKLQVLDIIDPTLIETKEHIIIVIIALIDAALDDAKNKPKADRNRVDDARRRMAEGLGLLDGIGKANPYGDEWEDAEWIMSRGLRKARSGRSFERSFNNYLAEALQVLCKKAFDLAFDDVDTNFQHGKALLETVRKYLTSPKLVLLISGDLELYGRLIRRNVYDNFGKAVMEFDPEIIGEEKTNISTAVQELEEQYLLKILPTQNRIKMTSLSGIMRSSDEDKEDVKLIPIGEYEGGLPSLLQWATNKVREKLLDSNSVPKHHPFVELICREHLRLVIEYLRAISKNDLGDVFSVFDTRLRYAGIKTLQLANTSHDGALYRAFDWLAGQINPTTLARFGVPSDANQAIVLHCLALAISREHKNSPAQCLRTLLTLSLPVSMMKRSGFSQLEVRKAMLAFIWGDASPDLLEVAARIGVIARSVTNEERLGSFGNLKASCFGSVGTKGEMKRLEVLKQIFDCKLVEDDDSKIKTVKNLYATVKRQNSKFSEKSWLGVIGEDGKVNTSQHFKGVAWFPLDDLKKRCGPFGVILDGLIYERFSIRGEKFSSISAISLLAITADLLAEKECEDIDLSKQKKILTIPAFIPFENTARTRLPEVESGLSSESDEEDIRNDHKVSPVKNQNTDYITKNQDQFDVFMDRIKVWKNFSKQVIIGGGKDENNKMQVSLPVLSQVAERIHDQLLSLDEEVSLEWKTGHILHRQITNILHAILVSTSEISGRFESPKTSDDVLIQSLQRVIDSKTTNLHPLAAIILSCPLIWVILPTNHGHSVKRVNYATEVNHEEGIQSPGEGPSALFSQLQIRSAGLGRTHRRLSGSQTARHS